MTKCAGISRWSIKKQLLRPLQFLLKVFVNMSTTYILNVYIHEQYVVFLSSHLYEEIKSGRT